MKALLIINSALSIAAALWLWQKDKYKALFTLILLLFVPVVGFVFWIGESLFEIKSSRFNHKRTIAEEEDIDIQMVSLAPPDRGSGIVPVSEALVLNDRKVKKELLINMLREDKTKYIDTLKHALRDEDSEASHYAAVALMEIKDSFNLLIETIDSELRTDKSNVKLMKEYEEVLRKSIVSGLNDKKRLRHLEDRYSDLLTRLIQSEDPCESYYSQKIDCDIRREDFESALKYAKQFRVDCPECEMAYLGLMKVYFAANSGEMFWKTMEELRRSNIILSREGIKKIRFWLGGA